MGIFGTDGIRGLVNKELTPEFSYCFGKAVALYLKEINEKPKIVIGKDTRTSCDMLCFSLASGLMSQGVDVDFVNVVPSPCISFLSQYYDLGIMVTASHNPANFNGIKIFQKSGEKIDDAIQNKLKFYLKSLSDYSNVNFNEIGKLIFNEDIANKYVIHLANIIGDLNGVAVLLDCAFGANYKFAPYIFKKLNANVKVINAENNGNQINNNCGVMHIEKLQNEMLCGKYEIGFAFDGDGDRVYACTKSGQILDGDKLIYVFSKLLKIKDSVVGTLMTNFGTEQSLEKLGIKLIRTEVGDKFVASKLKEKDLKLGGEKSGHIILSEYSVTGDGILVAGMLCKLLINENLDELLDGYQEYPHIEKSFKVEEKKKRIILKSKKIANILYDYENELINEGRLVFRPSGTEPVLRLLVEGKDYDTINKIACEIEKVVKIVIEEIQSNY